MEPMHRGSSWFAPRGAGEVNTAGISRGRVKSMRQYLACAVTLLAVAMGLMSSVKAGAEPGASQQPAPASSAAPRVVRGLEEPLVATDETTAQDDGALERALARFEDPQYATLDFPQRAAPLADYLDKYPASPWRAAILTNLGMGYYHSGYFSRALEAWQGAWMAGRAAKDPKARALVDRAVGELARMHARVGHAAQLDALFTEVGDRPITGSATEMMTGAHEGLWMFRHEPGESYLCGSKALENLLISLKAGPSAIKVVDAARSGPHGFSLGQVDELATRAGLAHRLIFRKRGQPVPVPSVINWRVHHYAAIVGVESGLYHIQDPTFGGSDLWVTQAAIDAESTGYFLIPTDPGPSDSSHKPWRTASAEEARHVYGMGYTAQNQPGSQTNNDQTLDNSTTSQNPTDPSGCSGMCRVNAFLMQVSLNLNDTPVGYHPQKGPAVFIRLSYNQRETNQPANFSFFNVSPKWTLNVLSYVQDNPAVAGQSVTRYVAGGGLIDYTYDYTYSTATGTFSPERQGQAVLARIPATGPASSYELRLPDGSKQVYATPDGSATYPRRMFLTQLIDPIGNGLTLNYDSQLRLSSITDATGRNTTFAYGLPANPLLVTQISDPFGRHADLTYDGMGRLASISDVIGMVSSFAYDASGLINSMTTPYGTSNFVYGDLVNNGRYLEITDPLGHTERLEFAHLAPGIPYNDPVVPSIGVDNVYLYYRNTFLWDKHLYPITHTDYTKARITHWLHNPIGQTSPIVESTKAPLENRVWNLYPGQSSTIVEGSSGTPLATGRVLDDGTTQARKFTYNSIGKPLTVTDPMGRETLYTYDANNVDVLQVQQKTSTSGNSTIAIFTYNSQHLPLTATGAAGETTSYTYNSAGQLTSVTNALSQVKGYAYDDLGRLISITNANGKLQETLTYDSYDRVATRTDSEGYALTYSYDALDRVTQINYPDGTATKYGYDKLDLASVTDRLGRTTLYTHDANRELTSITGPVGAVTRYSYYENGTLKSLTDPNGNVTSWDIDIQSRPTVRHYADGKIETYTYENATSRLKSRTDALNQVKAYGYSVDDRAVSITYTGAVNPTPNVSFSYDPYFPRLAGMTDGLGTTTYAYYAPGANGALKVATENGPYTANDTVSYAYDVLGRVIGRMVDSAAESFTYDTIGRTTGHTSALGAFGYAYLGQTGQVTSQALGSPAITTGYTYDTNTNDRRLLAITNSGAARSFSFTSTPEERITAMTETPGSGAAANSRTWSFGYDGDDRLLTASVTETTSSGGSSGGKCCRLHDHRHDHDPGHRHFPGHGYFCDALEDRADEWMSQQDEKRLESWGAFLTWLRGLHSSSFRQFAGHGLWRFDHHDRGGDWCKGKPSKGSSSTTTDNYVYGYDAADNIITFGLPSGSNAGTYNDLNELTSDGTRTYTYDINGNVLNDGVRNYAWDAENRLVQISLVADPTTFTQIRYDGFGRRTAVLVSSGTSTTETRYLWCGSGICQARDGSDKVTRRYFAEGESHVDTGAGLVYARDQIGSIRDTLNVSSGALVDTFDYDPYGDLTTTTTPVNPPDKLYAGMFYESGSGLYVTRYRRYDPSIGRWLSRDPAREAAGVNLYGYARGNPISFRDPHGLQSAPLNIPDPNGVVPGGPWTPAGPGQQPGTFYGPPQPSGPRSVCRYVPDAQNGGPAGADSPYWKTQQPGQQGWDRFDPNGDPITPEEAHPGNTPTPPDEAPPTPGEPTVPPAEPPAIPGTPEVTPEIPPWWEFLEPFLHFPLIIIIPPDYLPGAPGQGPPIAGVRPAVRSGDQVGVS